jgi:hypothetical protein
MNRNDDSYAAPENGPMQWIQRDATGIEFLNEDLQDA